MAMSAPDSEFFLEIRRLVEVLSQDVLIKSAIDNLVELGEIDKIWLNEFESRTCTKLKKFRKQVISYYLSTDSVLPDNLSGLNTQFDDFLSGRMVTSTSICNVLLENLGDMIQVIKLSNKPVIDLEKKWTKFERIYRRTLMKKVHKRLVEPSESWKSIMEGISLIDNNPKFTRKNFGLLMSRGTLAEQINSSNLPKEFKERYLRHLTRIKNYLIDEIDTGTHSLFLLNRFKERCEWFRASYIRNLCLSKKNPERKVKEQLARFLFDQGLTPIFESQFGNSRPDVTDFSVEGKLILEAKIFKTAGKTTILKGFNQAYRYVSTIGSNQGYYVVFNPIDVVLEVPQVVSVNEKLIHIIQVEISKTPPNKQRMKVVQITEDMFKSVVQSKPADKS